MKQFEKLRPLSFKDMPVMVARNPIMRDKDMLRPIKKQANALLPIAPPAMTEQDLINQKLARKRMRALVEKERCPICLSQLDGLVAEHTASLYCVANPSECSAEYRLPHQTPVSQTLVVSAEVDGYQISSQLLDNGLYKCSIYQLDMTLIEAFRMKGRKHLITFDAAECPDWCSSYAKVKESVDLLITFG
jgi:hypothetical protein